MKRIILASLALVAALCAGVTLGLTAPAWAGFYEGVAAYQRGDYATALREFRPLAERGIAIAQRNLGVMYIQGVTLDFVQAYKWLNIAASSFPPGKQRDRTAKIRDIVAEKMTPAQISEAQKLAREWRPKKHQK